MLKRLMTLLVTLAVIHPIAEANATGRVGRKLESTETRKSPPTLGGRSATVCVGSGLQGCGVWTQQGSKLVGTGVQGSVRQGYSVALSADGDTALVGAPLDGGLGGAAWVYTRSNGVWAQQGLKLVGPGAGGNAEQGYSVALSADANTALVGGPFDNGNLGAAWVFVRGAIAPPIEGPGANH
jgi:hypothetical protein